LADHPVSSLLKRIHFLWIFGILVFSAEIFSLYFFKDSATSFSSEVTFRTFLSEHGPYQFWMAAHSPNIFRVVFQTFLLILIIVISREFKKPNFFKLISAFQLDLMSVGVNVVSFTLLLSMLIIYSDPMPLISQPLSPASIFYTISPLLWLTYFLSIVSLLFPLRTAFQWIGKNALLTLFIATVTGFAINQDMSDGIINFWSAILLQPTLDLAFLLARGFGLDAQLFPSRGGFPVFGTSQFHVEIWPACSGYEGMALIISLLLAYCYIQRDVLRISRSLLVIPFACLAMFFLNAIRIAVLIAIGHFYSPELAINGFHLVAGWLNLLAIFIASLALLNLTPYFLMNPKLYMRDDIGDIIFLAPLVALITFGLFTKILVTNFDWLYPIPIFICVLILLWCRKYFFFIIERISFFAIIMGVLTFFLWVYLIPVDKNQSLYFLQHLENIPVGLSLLWLSFRLIGAVLIVPIAEELAFRGFLFPWSMDWFTNLLTRNAPLKPLSQYFNSISNFLSLILTSVLFGVLHSEMLAGSLAGIGFGLVYMHRRKLIDAIAAHAITNALLAIDVIYFGNWSYW